MASTARAVAVGLCAATILTGCSGVGNQGGDTTCADFNELDTKGQTAAITKMLQDDKGKEPTNLEVTGTRLSATAFCKTLGRDSSKIRDIRTG
ncbi:hypothetical protein [Mycobacterium sp. SMC-4]|uniref:hypothetical protein n=1 Tax=Mycobacterium sp. SMC-4 TaxID=2857059 RepID=UPI0021B2B514|nr:hypothetical protein [Mycobacterium sp. SMC-4]UXA19079.1 hypothetical protein KXD98_05320 [Mycobacterium sp. SMC-4]